MFKSSNSKFWNLTLLFVGIKIIIHLITNTNYELHRDAFLYLAQGEQLSWGYLSVPPLTAFLSKMLRLITGDSVFAVRLFPTLIGGASVVFINLIVREMGGKKWAMILASIAFILSPTFLRSNLLFQPVSLNQFFWLTSFYLLIRLINTENPKYWIYISVNFGLGFLNKYSIIFLATGIFLSLLLTPYRKLIWHRNFLFGILAGLVIISPNIWWQIQHSWPIVYHMEMLRQYHLVHVDLTDFLVAQVIMNLPVIFFWISGLVILLFHKEFKKYRVIGFTFISVMFLLIITQGKSYYTIGLYSTLFAAGGVAFAQYIPYKGIAIANLVFALLISGFMLPFSLPVLGHEKMLSFCEKTMKRGIDMPMRWEDGQIHPLPQDYADMIGWRELGGNVIKLYNNLSSEQKKRCYIYAENYGQAGAIRYFGSTQGIPDPICFHGSFIFWAPQDINDIKYLIYVNDEIEGIQDYFQEIIQYDGITNPYSRESGMSIYLCSNPTEDFKILYKARFAEEFERFNR